MVKFKFKFESVLNVKIIMEKKIQEEISLIEKEIKEYNHKRQIVIEERNRARQSLKGIHCKTPYQKIKIPLPHTVEVINPVERDGYTANLIALISINYNIFIS